MSCEESATRCITCGDEGIRMRVIALGPSLAICEDERHGRHEVAVDLLGPVDAGDELLVHAGVAIAHLSVAA